MSTFHSFVWEPIFWHIFGANVYSFEDILKQITDSESTLQDGSFDTYECQFQEEKKIDPPLWECAPLTSEREYKMRTNFDETFCEDSFLIVSWHMFKSPREIWKID